MFHPLRSAKEHEISHEISLTLSRTRSRLPVRGIIFLAPPHRGLDIDALRILVKGEPTEALIMELKSQSPTLTWLNQSFAQFARDIDILTCYENKPTNTVIKVSSHYIGYSITNICFRLTENGNEKDLLL